MLTSPPQGNSGRTMGENPQQLLLLSMRTMEYPFPFLRERKSMWLQDCSIDQPRILGEATGKIPRSPTLAGFQPKSLLLFVQPKLSGYDRQTSRLPSLCHSTYLNAPNHSMMQLTHVCQWRPLDDNLHSLDRTCWAQVTDCHLGGKTRMSLPPVSPSGETEKAK